MRAKLKHPLKLEIFRAVGEKYEQMHNEPISEPMLAYLINSTRVAYSRRYCGGLSGSTTIDAVIEPIKQCACSPDTPEDLERMVSPGCIVANFEVRLERDGKTLFQRIFPMARLDPVAYALINRHVLAQLKADEKVLKETEAVKNGEEDKRESERFVWRLRTNFLSTLPAPSLADGEDDVVLEESETDEQPVLCERPRGKKIGDLPEGDMPIYIRQKVLDRLFSHAEEAPQEREIGGALLGQLAVDEAKKVFVIIEDVPLLPTEGSACAVTFNWQAFKHLRERENELEYKTLLGLWHLHPDACEKAFASQQDLWGFQSFFPEPWHIFAIVGKRLEQTGFYQWTDDGGTEQVGFFVIDEN